MIGLLKGECHEIFCFWFFYESVSPQPQSIPLGPFRIFSKIRGVIRKSRCTTGVNDSGSRMRIKEFKNFNQKKWFLSSQKYDPSFTSQIWIPSLDPDFLPIPDPNPGSQIPIPGIKKAPDP
jgi:hypothetical protein